jgi:hypothetical protein
METTRSINSIPTSIRDCVSALVGLSYCMVSGWLPAVVLRGHAEGLL